MAEVLVQRGCEQIFSQAASGVLQPKAKVQYVPGGAAGPAAGGTAARAVAGLMVRGSALAGRLPCAARNLGPAPNSLHSLYSFRSNRRRQVGC